MTAPVPGQRRYEFAVKVEGRPGRPRRFTAVLDAGVCRRLLQVLNDPDGGSFYYAGIRRGTAIEAFWDAVLVGGRASRLRLEALDEDGADSNDVLRWLLREMGYDLAEML